MAASAPTAIAARWHSSGPEIMFSRRPRIVGAKSISLSKRYMSRLVNFNPFKQSRWWQSNETKK